MWTHLSACVRQKCQVAFSSATTTTFPRSSTMGARPSIFHCGATLQMVDCLLSLSRNSCEVHSRPGSEAMHRANSVLMCPRDNPFPTEGAEIKSFDYLTANWTLMKEFSKHVFVKKQSELSTYLGYLTCSVFRRKTSCVYLRRSF